jgi:hypothetical protein
MYVSVTKDIELHCRNYSIFVFEIEKASKCQAKFKFQALLRNIFLSWYVGTFKYSTIAKIHRQLKKSC